MKFYKFSLKSLTQNLLPYYEVFKDDSIQNNSRLIGQNTMMHEKSK